MRDTVSNLEEKAYQYRKRFLELFTALGFGHVTSAFSWAEVATVLMNEFVRFPGSDPAGAADKLVMSKGHGAGILFPIFEDLGLIGKEEMEDSLRIGGSNVSIRKCYLPGFDFYGGSLGLGLGFAAGIAKDIQLSGSEDRVYCIVGDAECYEGSIWEAAAFAGHNRLDRLIIVVDRNGLGCSDFTEHMLRLEPFEDKWKAFNWETQTIDGHDIRAIYDALDRAVSSNEAKPHCIIAETKKGKGLDYLIDRPLMHGYMPANEDIDRAFAELQHVRKGS